MHEQDETIEQEVVSHVPFETEPERKLTNRVCTAGRRKPYEKPQIVYRALLETMAGVCGSSPGKTLGDATCTIINS